MFYWKEFRISKYNS